MFVYYIYLSLQSLKCNDSFSPIGLEYISSKQIINTENGLIRLLFPTGQQETLLLC